MRPTGYRIVLLTLAVLFVAVPAAMATPNCDSAIIKERIFDDCPFSTLTTMNNYSSLISIDDANLSCGGFANLHIWTLSDDGGATEAVFNNDSWFRLAADLGHDVIERADGDLGKHVHHLEDVGIDV